MSTYYSGWVPVVVCDKDGRGFRAGCTTKFEDRGQGSNRRTVVKRAQEVEWGRVKADGHMDDLCPDHFALYLATSK